MGNTGKISGQNKGKYRDSPESIPQSSRKVLVNVLESKGRYWESAKILPGKYKEKKVIRIYLKVPKKYHQRT